ncbi:hypothetical protein PHMEG_00015203 [Phytophthora megakarya]|uniref:Uncharacterized protein n=1 Tax=Phytophthora megakarya TaxID=4795 RepID=A0A225W2D2_9STRA|nr:hypothetical protein PHMEG_00015203 [Phytophthora megakarya]
MRTIWRKYFARRIGPKADSRRLRTDPASSDKRHPMLYLIGGSKEVTPKEESKTIMPDPRHQDPGSMNHIHQEHRSKIQGDGFNRNRC